jgi:sialidase-1
MQHVLGLLLLLSAAAADGVPADNVVFRNGEDGYPFFRIPSLLRVDYGQQNLLLAFAEARAQRTDHGQVAIVQKQSRDGGETWSDLTIVHAVSRATIGNPTPLFEPEDQAVVLFFCVENKEIWVTRSTDGGSSWSAPGPIGWSRPSEWAWVATGPPAALRTSGGRWVLPCDGLEGSRQIYKAEKVFSFVLISDDRGASWRRSELLDGGNECQAAELANGSLALNMRSTKAVRLHASSSDGGLKWHGPMRATPAVLDGNVQGSMISMHGGEVLLSTSSGSGRRVLSAHRSSDGGGSWNLHTIVERSDAAYSSLVDLGGGWVGCLYETKRERSPAVAAPPPQAKTSTGSAATAQQRKRGPLDDMLVFKRIDVRDLLPSAVISDAGVKGHETHLPRSSTSMREVEHACEV